jgi:imidazolonepropionase-like amidohydrolase
VSPVLHCDARASKIQPVTNSQMAPRALKSDNFGTIEAGKFADIIAVKGDPIADISELTRVSFVMKGGAIYKQ